MNPPTLSPAPPPVVAASPGYKWELLALFWCANFLNQGDRQIFNAILPRIRDGLSEKELPHRHYAIELARRGYIAFAPDLFGYGPPFDSVNRWGYFEDFDKKYPQWSQADRTVYGLKRGLDVLDHLPMVRPGEYGAMGISLGGGNTTRLMAADPRIKAGVACSGTSPQSTHIYRLIDRQRGARVAFDTIVKKTGRVPYEITDILALCAPRPLMLTDAFDDPYNPDITATFTAVRNAWMVWHLLGAPERVSLLIHGDGHDTVDDVRDAGYRWMERWLPVRGVNE